MGDYESTSYFNFYFNVARKRQTVFPPDNDVA